MAQFIFYRLTYISIYFFFNFQIAEFSNCISDQGYLPLQLALTSKNLAIAETLVKNGFANINAYDAEVS